jgi:single-strand DNA-binding protein
MNTWFGIGTLTRDPELKTTPGGTQVASFAIAINEKFKGPDQKYTERADFFDCAVFGNSASSFCEYMAKGRKVAIRGKLRFDSWDDKATGAKRSRVSIFVEEWVMCDSKQMGQAQAPKQDGYTPSTSDDSPF